MLSGRTMRIGDDGTASDQQFFANDAAHTVRHQVPTVDQAELRKSRHSEGRVQF
jgi:hypothetical protein